MNSNLKIAGILILLAAVVFGVTFITQTSPPPNHRTITGPTPSGTPSELLLFGTREMQYSPDTGNIGHKFFQSCYEVNGNLDHPASFWFINRNPFEVQIGATARSCAVCTSARVGIVSPEARKEMLQDLAMGAFARGGMLGPDMMTIFAAAKLERSLAGKWTTLDFPTPPSQEPPGWAVVPSAESEKTPTLGVIQVMFKSMAILPYKEILATVAIQSATSPGSKAQFRILTHNVEPYMVFPPSIDFGEMGTNSNTKKDTVLYVSLTRGDKETVDLPAMDPPTAKLDIVDPFVTISTPIKLTDAELEYMSRSVSLQPEYGPQRVSAGYKVEVTINRHVEAKSPADPSEPDIGPLERTLVFSVKGEKSHSAAITAKITGLVELVSDDVIKLGRFNGMMGVDKEVVIKSDQTDLELEVANGEHSPKYLQATITPEKNQDEKRKYWKLKVHVDEKKCLNPLPANSFILLRGKTGGKDRKVRLLITGQGTSS